MILACRTSMIRAFLEAIRSCQGHMVRGHTAPCTQQAMKPSTLFASLLIPQTVPLTFDGSQSPSRMVGCTNSKMVFSASQRITMILILGLFSSGSCSNRK